MRQTGVLSASAAYALTHHFPRLAAVHAMARKLQAGLEDIGVRITSPAETCMVSASSTAPVSYELTLHLPRSSTIRPQLVQQCKRFMTAQPSYRSQSN